MEKNYIKICKLSELKEKQGKRFIIDDPDGTGHVFDIAVFKIDNEVFALSNVCPHQHTAVLYDGFIEDCCVVCPAHGWMFELRTGKRPTGSRGVDSYPVKIENDLVYVFLSKKEMQW